MHEESLLLDFQGEKLAASLQLADSNRRAVALLLHGGPGGHKEGPSDLYVHLASALGHAGVSSLRLDFFGEGQSSGDYVNTSASHQVAQYRHVMSWLRNEGFERVGVVGESFGGTCALGGYLADEVDALVLLWPAIWLLDTAFAPFTTAEQQQRVHNEGRLDIEGKFVGPGFIDELLSEPDREMQLRSVVAPTLLVHGTADVEVPVHQSEKAFELLQEPKRLVVVPDAAHCLRKPDEQEIAIRETTSWLARHLH